MSTLKKLAGQTFWYGMSNVAGRLLTFLLTPYFTYTLISAQGKLEYGIYSNIYLYFPVLNVLFTYGMETAFFRFSQDAKNKDHLYRSQLSSLLLSTALLTALLLLLKQPIANFLEIPTRAHYIPWCATILALDTLTTLPYALLRLENKPRKYAFTRLAGIVVFVVTIVLLFSFGKNIGNALPVLKPWLDKHWGLGYILFANILQSLVSLLLLCKEVLRYKFSWDSALLKKVWVYGFPILIAGFAGVINDSLNRAMFMKLYDAPKEVLLVQQGILGATTKMAIMITLAVQAFKMAAEPFFFSISKNSDAKDNYARVMLWFCIVLGIMFLNVVLFFDIWKNFIGHEYREALYLTPVLLLANIFLGVYYNLTIWYKLTDQTKFGAYIMMFGAAVTVLFNWVAIKHLGYAACVYSMFISYGSMMAISYLLGQKYYPIPYPVRKIAFYFLWMLVLAAAQGLVMLATENIVLHLLSGGVLFAAYLILVYKNEGMQMRALINKRK